MNDPVNIHSMVYRLLENARPRTKKVNDARAMVLNIGMGMEYPGGRVQCSDQIVHLLASDLGINIRAGIAFGYVAQHHVVYLLPIWFIGALLWEMKEDDFYTWRNLLGDGSGKPRLRPDHTRLYRSVRHRLRQHVTQRGQELLLVNALTAKPTGPLKAVAQALLRRVSEIGIAPEDHA